MSYKAPLKDMLFCIRHLAHFESMSRWPDLQSLDLDLNTAAAVLEESARFVESVVAPLNRAGDVQPSSMGAGQGVLTSPGFREAFEQFVAGGWQGLQHPAKYGGQGLPKVIAAACLEMLNSGNLSWALCPLLTDSAIEALTVAGSKPQQDLFLPKLIAGEWTGTMNLTEPQAGSDLSLVRTRAEPQADGSYKLFGTKIYITYGEHDLASNIIHFVLARIVGAPEGVKGLSLFIVPKFLINPDGSLGARNDVHCVSLEHKLGIRASPTVVLQYGDHGGAVGTLMGEAHRGLEYMFIMMSAARYAVGLQGIAVAECAYQKAVQYARERVQSRPVDGSSQEAVAIIKHPDVRRMLMTMRAQIEACRAMATAAAAACDAAKWHPDLTQRSSQKALYEFMVPLVKGYSTEMSIQVASMGVQVHGGMGFIEEAGAAQFYRDARILSIYEGTTAIQANDLLARKTLKDQARVPRWIAALIQETGHSLEASPESDAGANRLARQLRLARADWMDVVSFLLQQGSRNPDAVYAGSVPYLLMSAQMVAGWQMALAYLGAQAELKAGGDRSFLEAKQVTAVFYADHILSQSAGWRYAIMEGGGSVMALPEAEF